MNEWNHEKVRIWQAVIKSTGMPPAPDALDSLIDAYDDTLLRVDVARKILVDLLDWCEPHPMDPPACIKTAKEFIRSNDLRLVEPVQISRCGVAHPTGISRCALEDGHDGDHATVPSVWPRG